MDENNEFRYGGLSRLLGSRNERGSLRMPSSQSAERTGKVLQAKGSFSFMISVNLHTSADVKTSTWRRAAWQYPLLPS